MKSLLRGVGVLMVCFLGFVPVNKAQSVSDQPNELMVGIEYQVYPTGMLPGLALDWPVADKIALHLRLGYNYVRHRDLGKHDDERGDGYGFSLGCKTWPFQRLPRWSFELRSDLWFNRVTWRDDIPGADSDSGVTDITVLQPTLVAGYYVTVGNKYSLTPTLGFGAEINIMTDGEEVGEGAILLIGFQLVRKLSGD